MFVLVEVLQKNGIHRKYSKLQILTHVVSEAKKSHDVLKSSGWRTWKIGCIIQSKFESLRIRASVSVLDWAQRPIVREVKKIDVSAQAERKKMASPFTFLFHLSPQWIRCLSFSLVRVIFTQSADSSANLFWIYFHRHIQKCLIAIQAFFSNQVNTLN